MGLRQWVINVLEAGRTKSELDSATDIYPSYFGLLGGWRINRPTMKRTHVNMRLLSESSISRRAINLIKDGIAKLEWMVTTIDEKDQGKYQKMSISFHMFSVNQFYVILSGACIFN